MVTTPTNRWALLEQSTFTNSEVLSLMMNTIASWFIQLFTSWLFLLLVVPLLVALMAIVLKSAARPGKTFPLNREDFLIGFDLGVMAIVTMLAVAAKAAKELQSLH